MERGRPSAISGQAPARVDAHPNEMTTFREQIATNVLTVTKFRDLLHRMRENRPNDDLELVRKAYEFSQRIHAGQQRASGEPYLVHPVEVALVLVETRSARLISRPTRSSKPKTSAR